MRDGPEQKRKDKKRKENVYKSTAASPPHLSQPLRPLHTAIHLGATAVDAVPREDEQLDEEDEEDEEEENFELGVM